ncbi:MAG: hypothetical protein OXD44_01680 [Gammaproteobacteria bacterium]|nr:hypothetical protein [Gammaproteobacteria bacterium]MCY4312408.1 hypothetical protein [Gammaproteobacteria bacterium]
MAEKKPEIYIFLVLTKNFLEKIAMRESKRTVKVPDRSYQPKKAELEERIKVDVPGSTVEEKMNNFADAILRPAVVQYNSRK